MSCTQSRGTIATFIALLLSVILSARVGSAQTEDGSDWTTLLRRKGSLAPTRNAKLALVVDPTAERLEVTVRVTAGQSRILRRPSGQAVEQGAGVTIRKAGTGEVILVEHPEVGPWELEVRGSGDYAVAARVVSPLRFEELEFVRPLEAGPDGINTWAMIHGITHRRLPGMPVVGSGEPEVQAVATLSGDVASAVFTLESQEGAVLGELSLKQDPSTSVEGYLGAVPLPTVPFKVVVSGKLATPDAPEAPGVPYRRELATFLRATTVGVEPSHGVAFAPVAAGQSAKLTYRVRNRGASATFELSARDDLGFVIGVTPKTLSIPSGEIATATVEVRVSPAAESGTEDLVTLVATQVDQPEISNSAGTTLTVDPEAAKTELGRRLTE